MKANIISISNQKGGVGKTTTSINLATALAAINEKVLLIDLDPQGNATTGLGIYNRSKNTVYDILLKKITLLECITKTTVPGLSIIPANVNLIGAEIELVQSKNREYVLKNVLSAYEDMFDYIIIDSPPSMGLLTLNALVAADGVIVPLQCEYYALEGLSCLLKSISRIKTHYNNNLKLYGVILTMFDKRNSLCVSVEKDVRYHLKEKVFETVIPRNVKISEAPSYGKPVLIYDVRSQGSLSYMEVAKEFIEKEMKELWRQN